MLRGAIRQFHDDEMKWLTPRLGEIAHGEKKSDGARIDATTPLSHEFIQHSEVAATALGITTGPEFDRLVGQLLTSNASGLGVLGIDVRRLPGMGGTISHLRAGNVQLMVDAGRDYAGQVSEILDDPDSWGLTVDELASKIVERAGVAESHAELIARDQTLKLNGQINQVRQQAAGINDFIWSGSMDEKERDSHVAHEGQRFPWSAPPVDTGAPGQDIQCRCIGMPVIEELDGD